jgi:hypothetical protein
LQGVGVVVRLAVEAVLEVIVHLLEHQVVVHRLKVH